MPSIPGGVTIHTVAGGDHSFAVPKRAKDDVMRELVETAAAWMLER